MNKLQTSFTKKGWRHQQVERNEGCAIYRRWKYPDNAHYEVIRIRQGKAFAIAGVPFEAAEHYPTAEQWGVNGWTYSGANARKQAFEKYASLSTVTRRNRSVATRGSGQRKELVGSC